MDLDKLLESNDNVKRHYFKNKDSSSVEISALLNIANRNFKDVINGKDIISIDGRYCDAFNALFVLCKALVRSEGLTIECNNWKYVMIVSIPFIIGKNYAEKAAYLVECMKKRDVLNYEVGGVVKDYELNDLVSFLTEFKEVVRHWIYQNHEELVSS